jgi:hypothetical protein
VFHVDILLIFGFYPLRCLKRPVDWSC